MEKKSLSPFNFGLISRKKVIHRKPVLGLGLGFDFNPTTAFLKKKIIDPGSTPHFTDYRSTIEGNQSQSTSRPIVVEEPEVNRTVCHSFPHYRIAYIRKSGVRTLKNFCVRNPESGASVSIIRLKEFGIR